MRNVLIHSILWILFALCYIPTPAMAVPSLDAKEVLLQADLKRGPWKKFTLRAHIDAETAIGSQKNTYRVFFKNDTQTLVSIITPLQEKGNLLLMLKEYLWYYVKDTRQPIRITPLQRLAGSVSYGDLTRLSWSQDYKAESIEKDFIKHLGEMAAAYKLKLNAISEGATYHQIILWVRPDNNAPLKADVFFRSGKHFKTLVFTKYATIHDKLVNTQIKFIDHFNKKHESILDFDQVVVTDIPDRYFIKAGFPELSNELQE